MRHNLEPFHSVVVGTGSYGPEVIKKLLAPELTSVSMWTKDLQCFSIDSEAHTTSNTAALSHATAAIGKADLVFVVTSLASEAEVCLAATIAEAAKQRGALTVGIISNPDYCEVGTIPASSCNGYFILLRGVSSLIIIPQPQSAPTAVSYGVTIITGLLDLVTRSGLIGVDFADIGVVLGNGGLTRFGYGKSTGENRAIEAAIRALNGPSLTECKLGEAQGVIVAITGDANISLDEISEVAEVITSRCKEDISIFFQGFYDGKDNELSVLIIACAEGRAQSTSGNDDYTFDEEGFDTPAFIRRASSFGELVSGPVQPLPAEKPDGESE